MEGKKIAGVLCETVSLPDRLGIILSCGFNVNMPEELLKQSANEATSLAQLSGRLWNLSEVLDHIVQQFVLDFDVLYTQGFSAFKEEYEGRLAFKGQTIRCFDGIQSIEGICRGILPDGRLELLLPSQETIFLSAGELYQSSKNNVTFQRVKAPRFDALKCDIIFEDWYYKQYSHDPIPFARRWFSSVCTY